MQSEGAGDRVVVVTGASSGLGRLAAVACAKRGDRVVAGVRDQPALDALRADAADLAGTITPLIVDVTDPEAVATLGATAMREHGRIDAWINDAGVVLDANVVEIEPDELRRLLEVNVVGVLNGIRVAVPVLSGQGFGSVITIGTAESIGSSPHQSASAASKRAVTTLVDTLRRELAREVSPIRVILVEPGRVRRPPAQPARATVTRRLRPAALRGEGDPVIRAILRAADRPGEIHGRWHPATFASAWSTESSGALPMVARMLGVALLGTLAVTMARRR
jgi:NAD(P)-dependent dehydrogenase (short-subunit alcohol dehydrogenase family)